MDTLGRSVVKEMESNFQKRNIELLWFKDFKEIKEYLLEKVPINATVGIGNSQTLNGMDITEAFISRGNTVYNKELGTTLNEIKELKRKSLVADFYVSSSNAVSIDGRIVNIDHSGNRVAAIAFGPDKVFIVIGKNKVAASCDEAVTRAKNVAARMNAKRAGFNPPCVSAGHCVDCFSPDRVCNIISIIEGQHTKGRLTLLIANEDAGF